MNEYILFESLLRNTQIGLAITNITVKDNIVYFQIGKHKFGTVDYMIYHEKHPFYDHLITRIHAQTIHTPEGIERDIELNKKIDTEINLWYKHKQALFTILFKKAVRILADQGEEEFMKFVEHYFFITDASDNCKELLEKLENKSS